MHITEIYFLPQSLHFIDYHAFTKCESLESITIPDSITVISQNTFDFCKSLKSVRLPKKLKSINSDAFYGCISLESIDIPASKIYGYAFGNCTSLKYIFFSSDLKYLDSEAFPGCSSIEVFSIPEENPYYSTADGILLSKNRTKLVRYPTSRDYIELPGSVTDWEYGAFAGCRIEKLHIPSYITYVPFQGFKNCKNLKSIYIPSSVTSIGTEAFYECPSIENIYIESTNPPRLLHNDEFKTGNPFEEFTYYYNFNDPVYENATVYVPTGYLEKYKKSTWGGGAFQNIQEMDFSSVEAVPESGIEIYVEGNSIIVKGITEDNPIQIFDLSGNLIHQGFDSIIRDIPNGFYIVKIGHISHKIKI